MGKGEMPPLCIGFLSQHKEVPWPRACFLKAKLSFALSSPVLAVANQCVVRDCFGLSGKKKKTLFGRGAPTQLTRAFLGLWDRSPAKREVGDKSASLGYHFLPVSLCPTWLLPGVGLGHSWVPFTKFCLKTSQSQHNFWHLMEKLRPMEKN